MTGVYSFRPAPSYRGASRQELFDAALDQPLSMSSTFFDQAKAGVLESFGAGTAIRQLALPDAAPTEPGLAMQTPEREAITLPDTPQMRRRQTVQGVNVPRETTQQLDQRRADVKALSEDQYKSSAYFRKDIPYDPGMTEDRAATLAAWYDAKKVREYYAEKRPITSFFGNLAGQALDPINYIPVAGPLVKAAAVAKFGRVGGNAAASALDAAANTAVFGLGTAGAREALGDDVSWQRMVSEIATAAMIGGAFGTVGGLIGRRLDAKADTAIKERLSTLKTTQEARVALNEAIDGLARGEDLSLSPNATEPLIRIQREIIAYHGSPHTFDAFSRERIGSGEGAQAYGRGLYFAEKQEIAKFYQESLSATLADGDGRVAHGDADFEIMEAGRALGGVSQAKLDALSTNIVEALRSGDDPHGVISVLAKSDQERAAAKAMVEAATKFSKGDPGALYEVGIKADPDDFLDWDKPLSQQSDNVQSALKKQISDWEAYKDKTGGEYVEYGLGKNGHEITLMEAGIPGIKYLDASSRSGGDASRNFVVFDDGLVSIRSRNGQPIDTSPARPEPIPEGRPQAEARIAKPDDYKALAAQYRIDPETGSYLEEPEIAQVAAEGRLSDADLEAMAEAQATYDNGAAYGEALKAAVGCLI